MVDTVIGLDRLEEVARWAGEEARGYEKQVEAIERSAGQEPVKPLEEFDPSALASTRAAHDAAGGRALHARGAAGKAGGLCDDQVDDQVGGGPRRPQGRR